MELASKYDPNQVESKWYQYWLDNKLFSSHPDGREPYTVVIPPPNVTGVLQELLTCEIGLFDALLGKFAHDFCFCGY